MENSPRICAIISARDVARSIGNVFTQLYRAQITNCVLVLNGCLDETMAVVKHALDRVPMNCSLVLNTTSLGHDVPKAIGLYHAVRTFRELEWALFVDGDWSGGFGPMLDECIKEAVKQNNDIQFVPRRLDDNNTTSTRTDYQIWDKGLRARDEGLKRIAPSESPLLVSRRTFAHISPYYLYHPGLWFALSVQESEHRTLRLGLSEAWSSRIAGNPSPSVQHARMMKDTLIGDALEGARVLLNQHPHRNWHGKVYDGYHSLRRIDILKRWQSSASR